MGSASRDLERTDQRGWRLGGGVTYGALALARLGLSVGAVMGVDAAAASAWELDLLRGAGVAVHAVRLRRGPVFTNDDRSGARHQLCHEPGDAVAVTAAPAAWRRVHAWLFAPIADELPGPWAAIPPADALVALGWQGLLRRLGPGQPVRRRPAGPHPLLARASLVGASSHDLAPTLTFARLARWVGADRPDGAELVLTAGRRGGLAIRFGQRRAGRRCLVPPFASRREVDPTGAGDVFLAALFAGRIQGEGGMGRADGALAVAAAAASLSIEGLGVAGVPTLAQIALRLCLAPGSAARA